MKKKILALSLCTTLLLTACGSQTTEATPATPTESSVATETSVAESIATESTTEANELEALGSIEVEKELFDVSITLPADIMGEITQAELDKTCIEMGYGSITLNEDGSATYVMTKSQHKKLLEETKTSFDTSLAEMIGDENYPNVTDINANDDFTEFTITTKSTELSITESFSVMVFYMYGGMYGRFAGTEVDNVSVTFINADSGEVISTANSSDME